MLNKLNELNKFEIKSIDCNEFKKYGKVIKNYDTSRLITYLENETIIPEDGNLYIANDKEMSNYIDSKVMSMNLYGGMDIQVGYCNGKNSTLNGLEYHKGSEVNVFADDAILFLGSLDKVKNNSFNVDDIEAFFFKKGTCIELYQTALHFAPCKVSDKGFKVAVILPKDTNTALENKQIIKEDEDRLLFMKNKWLIAHPQRTPLIEKGAYGGIIGENLEVIYK